MTNSDYKQRFFFSDCDIRGEILRLESSLAPILQAHDYPLSVQGILSEAVAAVALMASTLKFQGRLSLQAQGNGPVNLLLAESTHDGQMRGLAKHEDNIHDEGDQPSLADLFGDGAVMAITICPWQGQQYQGIVPLDGHNLATCLEHYFSQSEQLKTRLWLTDGNGRAAGLLIQQLPNQVATPDQNASAWQHIETLADTLTMEELLDLPPETVLHRLFHEQPHQLTAPDVLRFGCTCSREKVQNTLQSLGAEELQSILDEIGEAAISCDFCGCTETFDAVDLGQLIHQLTP